MSAPMMGYIAFLRPELIILAGVILILFWGMVFPNRRSSGTSLFTLMVLTLSLILLIVSRQIHGGGPMIIEGNFSLVFRVMIVFAASMTIFLSHNYLQDKGIGSIEYHLLILLSTLGMMLTAAASHFLVFFIGIELMGLSFYILTAMKPGSASSKEAALKYLFYGLAASAVMLFGLSIVFGIWGSWDMNYIGRQAAEGHMGPAGSLALAMILVGIGFKIGLAPFHMWVPDVFDGSPPPVAAFLSVGPKVATFGAAAFILVKAFAGGASVWMPMLWIMAVLSMIWGNLAALTQKSLKRMIAYSSVAHVGYISVGLLAAARRPVDGLGGVAFYLFAYIFFNLGFFALIIWLEKPGGEGPFLSDIAGLGKRQPMAAGIFSIFLLALAGIPPTSGFMAKFWVFLAAVRAEMIGLAIIGVLSSAVAAFYYLRIVYYFFMKEPEGDGEVPSLTMNISLYAILLACLTTLWFGIWSRHLLEFVSLTRLP